MALKAFVKSLEGVDEKYHDLYEKTDDGYVLNVDESDYKGKISEFRDNNIKLSKAEKDLRAKVEKYKDIDPEKYQEGLAALEKLQEQGDKKLIDEGKIEELITQRTERMRNDFNGKAVAMQKSLDEAKAEGTRLRERLTKVLIDNSVQSAITQVGSVRKGAMTDVLQRARQTWSIDEEGKPVPKREDGEIIYGKDGAKVLTMEEWATSLLDEAPFLFEGSTGGGADGSKGKGEAKPGTIRVSSPTEFGKNLEDIASGKVTVVTG